MKHERSRDTSTLMVKFCHSNETWKVEQLSLVVQYLRSINNYDKKNVKNGGVHFKPNNINSHSVTLEGTRNMPSFTTPLLPTGNVSSCRSPSSGCWGWYCSSRSYVCSGGNSSAHSQLPHQASLELLTKSRYHPREGFSPEEQPGVPSPIAEPL